MKEPNPDFVKRLKELAGDNVSEFARHLGMNQSLVNKYVTGETSPGLEFFVRLAAAGYDTKYLLTGIRRIKASTVYPIPVRLDLNPAAFKALERFVLTISQLSPEVVVETLEICNAILKQQIRKSRKTGTE